MGIGRIRFGGKVAPVNSFIALDANHSGNDKPVHGGGVSGEAAKNAEDLAPASLSSCRDQVEALQLTIAQLQSTNTQLLNDISAEHIKHRKELGALRKEVTQLFGELTREQETDQELLEKVGTLEGRLADAANMIGTLDAENDRLLGKVNSLNEQVADLQGQLNQSGSGSALQAQLDAALKENSDLKAQVDSLNSQVTGLQAAASPDVAQQLAQAQQANDKLNSQLTASQEQVASLQAQLQHATDEANVTLQSQLDAALENNIALTLQNASLAARVSELTQKLAEEDQEIVEAHAELDQLNGQMVEMVGKLSTLRDSPAACPAPTGVIGDETVGDAPATPIVPSAPDTSVIPNIPASSDTPTTPDTVVIPNILSEPESADNKKSNDSSTSTESESVLERIKHKLWGF